MINEHRTSIRKLSTRLLYFHTLFFRDDPTTALLCDAAQCDYAIEEVDTRHGSFIFPLAIRHVLFCQVKVGKAADLSDIGYDLKSQLSCFNS